MKKKEPTSVAPPENPYRPGAGHRPPFLAGRDRQKRAFAAMLTPPPILKNLIITGLRGVGKTVLLEDLRDLAVARGWAWVGNEMSASACTTEENMSIRILADLSKATSSITINREQRDGLQTSADIVVLDYKGLWQIHEETPGLVSDRLLATIRVAAQSIKGSGLNGIVFAYDEAQSLSDHAELDHYPTAVLLDVFQRLQREGLPVLLVLAGLPTLQGKLAKSRTYSERMFSTEVIDKLTDDESREAIMKPLETSNRFPKPYPGDVQIIIENSGGYPYFIQFICRDTYDILIQNMISKRARTPIHIQDIMRRLDTDFYANRWAITTEAQRDLLRTIAMIQTCGTGFSIKEIQDIAKAYGGKNLHNSTLNKMLKDLCESGLVYKASHGRYTFGVPMFENFILRQIQEV